MRMEKVDEKEYLKDKSDTKEDSITSEITSTDDDSSSASSEGRERWTNKLDFILSLVGYSVAFGNVQRFPYLCFKNGGGAFLIPFFFFLLTCGVPLYFLEVCLGQFSGKSPLFVWKLCPLFRGIGILMVLISGICSYYYNNLIAWSLYYLGNSFKDILPWSSCTNEWNTANCQDTVHGYSRSNETYNSFHGNNETYIGNYSTYTSNISLNGNNEVPYPIGKGNVSASLEFWKHGLLRISSGIDDVGTVQWHLALSLLGAWILVFLCLIKGVKSLGKVVYVTALLPYVLFLVFLIQGLTLPGSLDGIAYYLTPDFSRLLHSQVWLEASVQVFFSLGPCWGGVITMASYSEFHSNCLRTSIFVSLVEGFTSLLFGFIVFSILGFMAHELGQSVAEVAENGPGIIFITYPEAITKLPLSQFWAVLFWIMMITVGLDTQFGMFETLTSGIVDAFPTTLRKRKTLVVGMTAAVMFLFGLPITTNAGMYIYQLIDWYCAAFCMLLCGFLETIVIGWIYGAERFSRDIELMINRSVPIPIRFCWCFVCPVVLLVALLVILYNYQAPVYDGYEYPNSACIIGIIIGLVPVLPVPIVMIIQILIRKGTLIERLKSSVEPDADWLPYEKKYWEMYASRTPPTPRTFLERIKMNIVGCGDTSYGTDLTVRDESMNGDLTKIGVKV